MIGPQLLRRYQVKAGVMIGNLAQGPAVSLEFLGAVFGGDRKAVITRRITEAWGKLLSMNMKTLGSASRRGDSSSTGS